MRYENRANPYPFFDELRKTPVVAGGRRRLRRHRLPRAAAAAPRPAGQLGHLAKPISAQPAARRSPTPAPTHARRTAGSQPHRVGPARARQAAPPGDAALRAAALARTSSPTWSRTSSRCATSCWTRSTPRASTTVRRRRRLRLSGAGDRDLQDPRRAAEGRTHASTAGSSTSWTGRTSARTPTTEEGQRRTAEGPARAAPRSPQYLADLIDGYLHGARTGMLSKLVNDRRPGRADDAQEAVVQRDAPALRRA